MTELEPGRPLPNFTVLIERDDGEWTGDSLAMALQDVYDVAINSMDFGSGFLSTEEVGSLRILGEAIGANHFDYQHDKCHRCGHEKDRHYGNPIAYCHTHPYPYDQPKCDCKGFVSPA